MEQQDQNETSRQRRGKTVRYSGRDRQEGVVDGQDLPMEVLQLVEGGSSEGVQHLDTALEVALCQSPSVKEEAIVVRSVTDRSELGVSFPHGMQFFDLGNQSSKASLPLFRRETTQSAGGNGQLLAIQEPRTRRGEIYSAKKGIG